MKFLKVTLLVVLLGALTLGMANGAAVSTSTSTSVDVQIAAIQTASAEKRVQMMNEFKQRLANMNQKERMTTIAKMQEKMQGKSASGSTTRDQAHNTKENGGEMGEMMKERAHNMTQEKQMQANEQMSHMQNMNQMQAGSQYMEMHENGYDSSMPRNGGGTGDSNYDMNRWQH